MTALCPHCLQRTTLTVVDDPEQGRVLRCENPRCDYPFIPLMYADDYATHPPTPVSIIGLSGHGKTVYIGSLLDELEYLGGRWTGDFHYVWLDETQMREASVRIRNLRSGQMPTGTRTVFQRPQVVRLSNVPRVGGSQLIFFDTGGEAFLDSATLADAGKYVRDSSAVLWLLSLKRGDPYDTPDDVNQMMTVYLQSMARMGARTQDQTLILVLTKGDELLWRPDLPDSARTALTTADYSPAGKVWATLDQASTDLEAWLKSEACGYHNLVNLVKSRFKAVRYCIVSAQGGPDYFPETQRTSTTPRGVLAPLLWLWRLERNPVWVEREGVRELYLDVPQAVAAASRATVRFEDRVYSIAETLHLRKSVTLVGAGAGRTVLEVMHPGYGLGSAGEKVTLRGLTVRRPLTAQPGDVIRVVDGELELADVTVTGGLSGTLNGKRISGQGILVAKQSKLIASACEFRGNHGSGILVLENGQLQATECQFEGNGEAGIFVKTTGTATLLRNQARTNQTGLRIDAASAATVEGNVLEGNGGCGMVLGGGLTAAIVVQGNRCVGNSRDGLQLRGYAAPTITGNSCEMNKRSGLAFTEQSSGVVRGNTAARNGQNGVRITDSATPDLEENVAEGNTECGFLYEGRGAGTARRNTARDNRGDGIRLEGTGRPQLEENESRFNDGYGVAVAEPKSTVVFDPRKNKFDGNRKGPILETRHPKKSGGWWQ